MALSREDRHQIEQQFHDRAAQVERTDFYAWGALRAADDYAYSLLGDLRGRTVLDLGCGQGQHALAFAGRGATVAATDVAAGMVEATLQRAAAAGLADRVTGRQMAAEQLLFPNDAFDLVFGHSVIHHTELVAARQEILRVLKPGGRAIFLEPLDHNPAIKLFRMLTPSRRTPTEQPLRWRDVLLFAEPFAHYDYQVFYFSALAAFVTLPLRRRALFESLLRLGERVDRRVFRAVPGLRRYAWVIVLQLTK